MSLATLNGVTPYEPDVITRDDETLLIRARAVRPGDLLDLEGDRFADPGGSDRFEFEYERASVVEVTGAATSITFESGFGCAWPSDYAIKLAPEYALLRAAYDGLTRGGFQHGTPQYAAARQAFDEAQASDEDAFYQGLYIAQDQRRDDYRAESSAIFAEASEIAKGYITTALWCGVEYPSGDPRSDSERETKLNPDDISPGDLRQMIQHADSWARMNADLIAAVKAAGFRCGPDYDQDGHLGHDLWLTSNGHGAGFWDGDYPKPFGDQLTESSKALGEHSLYLTIDGTVEIQGG